MHKNRQNGRSMIEMLGVLAIIGVLSAGGIAGYSMAMESYKVNKTIQTIIYATARTAEVFSQMSKEDSLRDTYIRPEHLCALHVLPEDICNNNEEGWEDKYRKGYFGERIAPNSAIVSDADLPLMSIDDEEITVYAPSSRFNWDFNSKIPIGACVKLVTGTGWTSAGQLALTYSLGDTLRMELPLDVSKAVAACTAEDNSESYYWAINIIIEAATIE